MGGGLSERNTLLAQCMTALFEALAFLITGIHGITVPTAGPKWTEVLTMRLIDAELLEEQFGISDADILAKEEIRFAPTVDAVVVTRCKDCRSYNKPKTGWCEVHLDRKHPDDFCSYGKRKDGGDG